MQTFTPSQQLTALNARLGSLYLELDNLDRRRAQLREEIDAVRNTLAGVQLGQQVAAESAPAPAAEPAPTE